MIFDEDLCVIQDRIMKSQLKWVDCGEGRMFQRDLTINGLSQCGRLSKFMALTFRAPFESSLCFLKILTSTGIKLKDLVTFVCVLNK